MFIYPTLVRRITSHFRPVNRPNHHGTDFADQGIHEIFAVADGEVTRSNYSVGYGECVFIVHSIAGKTWESVYAHMRAGSRRFKVGEKVQVGQVLGIMGDSGDATGQHLHFELHLGRWNANKTNAVNPIHHLVEYENYTIKAGDTFWALEQRWGLLTGTLQRMNPNVNSARLQIGQVIRIFPSVQTQFLIRVVVEQLWYYNRPDWNARAGIVKHGEVFTVVETLTVNGSTMYKLKSGNFLTANLQYVEKV